MKVSVILPSLNVRKYIRECVESVLDQTLQDIEIICVDAGSTDGTLEILQEYARKDSRMKIIVSDKKSYGYQMNLGMDAATGEYIGIVETDDYVPKEMYEELYDIAVENAVDFVKADFYRFTGEGKKQHMALYSLTEESYYNCVIDIEKEQECFKFPMNTWSGIYNRKFLEKNNIYHNETPGASYQDNGFWFQTFIYAKRAYFVNKPYYRNRRDNPKSSVFSKDKVFCICDEYQYILQILKADDSLFEHFKYTFAYVCYQAYKGTFGRIGEEHKEEFLQRFSEDLCELQKLGALKESYFNRVDWKILNSIMKAPLKFYNEDAQKKKQTYEKISHYDRIIIYGAGMIGKQTYHALMDMGCGKKIICFAVSEEQKNFDYYDGVQIVGIERLLDCCRNSLIVTAVTELYRKEIEEKLEELGFEHVLSIPE